MRTSYLAALLGVCLATATAGSPKAEVFITVDKAVQRMIVTVDGQPRYDWPVSTGADGYDTPGGSYRPQRMERTHFSREFDDAPMPFAIFFTGQGHAIHGTNHLRQLGSAVSHGCVRLSVRNAAVLFALVKAEGTGNTHVQIEGDDLSMATGNSGYRQTARTRRGYEADSIMSAGDQMGRGL
ncbi:L,D-transpeptidase [Methylobacterium sp. WL103]|uniref:L,D-transpeptidase n=1 Tax=Methylobacterium sp. WL103 TaxID=2603891 RepID=UPI0011C80DC1|nr:L,D-transpeptidase [Methylobacterium sp. WL103]TXN02796.1 L,D-transpeptidase [Methylobacterium sp. WL103]